jgi:hypothetical protein
MSDQPEKMWYLTDYALKDGYIRAVPQKSCTISSFGPGYLVVDTHDGGRYVPPTDYFDNVDRAADRYRDLIRAELCRLNNKIQRLTDLLDWEPVIN